MYRALLPARTFFLLRSDLRQHRIRSCSSPGAKNGEDLGAKDLVYDSMLMLGDIGQNHTISSRQKCCQEWRMEKSRTLYQGIL